MINLKANKPVLKDILSAIKYNIIKHITTYFYIILLFSIFKNKIKLTDE